MDSGRPLKYDMKMPEVATEESKLDIIIRKLDAALTRMSEHNKLFMDVLEKADGPDHADVPKANPDLPVGEERYRVLYKLADLVDLAERQTYLLEKNVYRLRELI